MCVVGIPLPSYSGSVFSPSSSVCSSREVLLLQNPAVFSDISGIQLIVTL